MIIIIAATAENRALGKDNRLLWHLPDDFKRFKEITTGHHIIMGRKTFESLARPLPNRTHIIVTRQKDYKADNCLIAESLQQAISLSPSDQNVFVIGGGEIYRQAMDLADEIDLTKVHVEIDADTWFPEIDSSKWERVSEQFHGADDKHLYAFTFEKYRRIRK